jgi:hypothetical protein
MAGNLVGECSFVMVLLLIQAVFNDESSRVLLRRSSLITCPQMFEAVWFIQRRRTVNTDIKPDNDIQVSVHDKLSHVHRRLSPARRRLLEASDEIKTEVTFSDSLMDARFLL